MNYSVMFFCTVQSSASFELYKGCYFSVANTSNVWGPFGRSNDFMYMCFLHVYAVRGRQNQFICSHQHCN